MTCVVRSLATLFQSSRNSGGDDTRVERARELVEKVWSRWGEGRRERWRRAIGASIERSCMNKKGENNKDGVVMVTPLKLWLVRAEVEEMGGATVWGPGLKGKGKGRVERKGKGKNLKRVVSPRVVDGSKGEDGKRRMDSKRTVDDRNVVHGVEKTKKEKKDEQASALAAERAACEQYAAESYPSERYSSGRYARARNSLTSMLSNSSISSERAACEQYAVETFPSERYSCGRYARGRHSLASVQRMRSNSSASPSRSASQGTTLPNTVYLNSSKRSCALSLDASTSSTRSCVATTGSRAASYAYRTLSSSAASTAPTESSSSASRVVVHDPVQMHRQHSQDKATPSPASGLKNTGVRYAHQDRGQGRIPLDAFISSRSKRSASNRKSSFNLQRDLPSTRSGKFPYPRMEQRTAGTKRPATTRDNENKKKIDYTSGRAEDNQCIDFLLSMEVLVGDARSLRAYKRGPFAAWLWHFVVTADREQQVAVVKRVTISALARLLVFLYLDCFDFTAICDDRDIIRRFFESRAQGIVVQELAEEVFWKFGGNAAPDGLGKADFKSLASTIEAAYVESGLVKASLGLLEVGPPTGNCVVEARSVFTARTYMVKSMARKDPCTVHPVRALSNNPHIKAVFQKLLRVHRHPNIANLRAVRVTESSIHFIFEHGDFGSLAQILDAVCIEKFSHAVEHKARHTSPSLLGAANEENLLEKVRMKLSRKRVRPPFPEKLVQYFFKQLFSAIAACHANGIAHCQINLANLVLTSDLTLKLVDFDSARGFANESELRKPVKTDERVSQVLYHSPEEISGQAYSLPKADMWSCGVCLYFLLVGRPPFSGKNYDQVVKAISAGRYQVPSHVSPYARSLLAKLLYRDARHRITAAEALGHPWLQVRAMEKIKNISARTESNNGLLSPCISGYFTDILNEHLRAHWVLGAFQLAKMAKSTLENVLNRYSVQSVCRRGTCATLWEYDCAVPALGITFVIRLLGFEDRKFSGRLWLSSERQHGPYAVYVRRILLIAKAWHAGLPKRGSRDLASSSRLKGIERLLASRSRLSNSLPFRSGRLRR